MYKLKDFAQDISVAIKDVQSSPFDRFVGLEHYDSGEPVITRYTDKSLLSSSVKEFRKNDILIARRNVYLKRAGIAFFDGLTSGDSIVLRVYDDCESRTGISKQDAIRIIPFILNSNAFWAYANKHSDGMNSKRISKEMLYDYEFDLPPIAEQKVLADKLWAAYRLKESYKKLLTATEEMVKSQFIEMFGQSTFTIEMQECFSMIRNGANIKQGQVEGGFPITRIETISDETIDREKMGYAGIIDNKYESYYLADGDILVSHINSLKHIGKCALYSKQEDEIIIHGMNLLCLRPIREIVVPAFAIHMLRSDIIKKQIADITKPAVNQASFSVKDFGRIKAIIPDPDEQNKFVAIAEQADKSGSVLQHMIAC